MILHVMTQPRPRVARNSDFSESFSRHMQNRESVGEFPMILQAQLQYKNLAHSVSNWRIWLLWQAQDAFQVNVKADMLRIWYGKIAYRVT